MQSAKKRISSCSSNEDKTLSPSSSFLYRTKKKRERERPRCRCRESNEDKGSEIRGNKFSFSNNDYSSPLCRARESSSTTFLLPLFSRERECENLIATSHYYSRLRRVEGVTKRRRKNKRERERSDTSFPPAAFMCSPGNPFNFPSALRARAPVFYLLLRMFERRA